VPQSTVDTILGVLITAVLGVLGYSIRRQITSNDTTRIALTQQATDFTAALTRLGETFADKVGQMTVSLAELNTGASAGARAAIADLRLELRTGISNLDHDVGQLRTEHDALAERHHSLNVTVTTLAERGNLTRELVHEIRRDLGRVGSGALAVPADGSR